MKHAVTFPLSLAVVLAVAAGTASASCGIRECPVPEPLPPRWSFTSEARWTSFEDPEYAAAGNYGSLSLRGDVRAGRVRAAGFLPFITLRLDGEPERTGLGNPVAMTEVRVWAAPAWRSGLGAQLEFPWGDSEDGLASDHFEVLPYVWVATGTERSGLSATVGLRAALGSPTFERSSSAPPAPGPGGIAMHLGQAHREPVYVNPHEQREIGWRAGGGRQLLGSGWSGSLFAEGAYVLEGPTEGTHYVSGELGLAAPISRHVALGAHLAAPLTEARRFELTAGIGFSLR